MADRSLRRAGAVCFVNVVLGAMVPVAIFMWRDVLWLVGFAIMGLQIYVLLALNALLAKRFDFQGAKVPVLTMVGVLCVLCIALLAEGMLSGVGRAFLLVARGAVIVAIAHLVIVIHVRRWGRNPYGLLSVYCYLSILGFALLAVAALALLGMLFIGVAEIVLGILFMRAAVESPRGT